MKDEQKNNLLKLARYLDNLPDDYYEHFDMKYFYLNPKSNPEDIEKKAIECDLSECGSTACALGHGIPAGIPWPEGDEGNWTQYSKEQFGLERGTKKWLFLFGVNWPDDPKEAAERINYLVEGKIGNPEYDRYLN